jgi:UDP-glucose 4-epimerase
MASTKPGAVQDAYGDEFENATHRRPELNKLRALTGFTPEWTLGDTLDELIEIERASNLRVA